MENRGRRAAAPVRALGGPQRGPGGLLLLLPGVLLRVVVDAGLGALRRGDRRRRTGQRVAAGGRLGERDDVADRLAAGEQGDDAVPAEGDAAVRGRAEDRKSTRLNSS